MPIRFRSEAHPSPSGSYQMCTHLDKYPATGAFIPIWVLPELYPPYRYYRCIHPYLGSDQRCVNAHSGFTSCVSIPIGILPDAYLSL